MIEKEGERCKVEPIKLRERRRGGGQKEGKEKGKIEREGNRARIQKNHKRENGEIKKGIKGRTREVERERRKGRRREKEGEIEHIN